MTAPIERLDVPAPVVAARMKLLTLQADPPAGHGPVEQPHDWYEAAFDALITAQTDQPGGKS